jgi:hypothetical protein
MTFVVWIFSDKKIATSHKNSKLLLKPTSMSGF